MYKKSFGPIRAIAALLTTVLLAASAAAGGNPDDAAANVTVEGTLTYTEVDGTVVIKPQDSGALIVYAGDATRIYRNGRPAGLADLQRGDRIRATYAPDRSAIEIRAEGS